MSGAGAKRGRGDTASSSSSSSSPSSSSSSSSASSSFSAGAGGAGGGGGGGATREELLALVAARDAGHAATLAALAAAHAGREAQHAAALAAAGAERDAAVLARDAALATAGAERLSAAAAAAERDAERALTRTLLARDATLASALAERDALRRRLALPNVRAALRGEDFLDVIGVVSSVGYAADVSHCRELCRLTRDIVQRGDVADMLAQSLRLQCGAREARAAGREDFSTPSPWVGFRARGTTQLIRAAILNNLPRVLQLIQLGAPLELGDTWFCSAALDWAASLGHEHIVKALLDGKYEGRGAVVDGRNKQGTTPLMSACMWGQEAAVRLLLLRGAKQELQDNEGDTVLHIAVDRGHTGIVELLCSAPGAAAALALKNSTGETPLGLALIHGERADCVAVLRAHGAPE
jgi:hypothetical protein